MFKDHISKSDVFLKNMKTVNVDLINKFVIVKINLKTLF